MGKENASITEVLQKYFPEPRPFDLNKYSKTISEAYLSSANKNSLVKYYILSTELKRRLTASHTKELFNDIANCFDSNEYSKRIEILTTSLLKGEEFDDAFSKLSPIISSHQEIPTKAQKSFEEIMLEHRKNAEQVGEEAKLAAERKWENARNSSKKIKALKPSDEKILKIAALIAEPEDRAKAEQEASEKYDKIRKNSIDKAQNRIKDEQEALTVQKGLNSSPQVYDEDTEPAQETPEQMRLSLLESLAKSLPVRPKRNIEDLLQAIDHEEETPQNPKLKEIREATRKAELAAAEAKQAAVNANNVASGLDKNSPMKSVFNSITEGNHELLKTFWNHAKYVGRFSTQEMLNNNINGNNIRDSISKIKKNPEEIVSTILRLVASSSREPGRVKKFLSYKENGETFIDKIYKIDSKVANNSKKEEMILNTLIYSVKEKHIKMEDLPSLSNNIYYKDNLEKYKNIINEFQKESLKNTSKHLGAQIANHTAVTNTYAQLRKPKSQERSM